MAEAATVYALAPIQTRKKTGFAGMVHRLGLPLRRLFGVESADDNSVEAQAAVAYFLGEMLSVAARTYPVWSRLLDDALSECNLGFDDRRELFDVHPIDDYFFAGVVALECARMRGYYDPIESSEILGEVGDQVDAAAARHDRAVSDLVFFILGKIELGAGVDRMKVPHDKVVKAILLHMGIHKIEATQPLMSDKALRHALGEPLALGVPQWWKAFHAQFNLYWSSPDEDEESPSEDPEVEPSSTASVVPLAPMRGRRRRRATAF